MGFGRLTMGLLPKSAESLAQEAIQEDKPLMVRLLNLLYVLFLRLKVQNEISKGNFDLSKGQNLQ